MTGFVISYTVLVYCILDLVWVNRTPYWATLSTVTFIVGLWAPSPGQGLASSKPAQAMRKWLRDVRK